MSSFASHFLLGIALFTASLPTSLAQLGANEVEARARYGPPRRIDDRIEPDERQIIFRTRGYAIGTSFVRGIVCRISYEHADATPLAAAEIDGFLRASVQGSQWHQDAKDVWSRADHNAMAAFSIAATRQACILRCCTFTPSSDMTPDRGLPIQPAPSMRTANPAIA
jgi:hypothetical protein